MRFTLTIVNADNSGKSLSDLLHKVAAEASGVSVGAGTVNTITDDAGTPIGSWALSS